MTQRSDTLDRIPLRVKAFGRMWAIKFMMDNPNWEDGSVHDDIWHGMNGYDINLYCEDGNLSVSAYATIDEGDGHVMTDYSHWVYLYKKHKP